LDILRLGQDVVENLIIERWQYGRSLLSVTWY
jgi:hypothetical protein